jgi:hypothetical protein
MRQEEAEEVKDALRFCVVMSKELLALPLDVLVLRLLVATVNVLLGKPAQFFLINLDARQVKVRRILLVCILYVFM